MTDTPKDPESMYEVSPELMQQLSDEFTQLTFKRHVDGAREYGEFAFLGNDMLDFIAEELADICNYCRYTYMKLRLWKGMLDAGGIDFADLTSSGTASGSSEQGVPSSFASSSEATNVSPILPGGEGPEDPGQRSS